MKFRFFISNHKWRLNRLCLMSPMEIGFRVKEEAKKKYEKVFVKDFSPKTSFMDKKTNWYFDIADRDRIISFLKRNYIWDENKAKELLEHRLSFFSLHEKFLGKIINWHRDYKNNKEAPLRYCKDIDYRDSDKLGDIKYIWEINRHLHLVLLAKAYFLTKKQKYKDEVKEQITSWIKTNPYREGVNWESPLELAIRLISWSWVWFFLEDIDHRFKKLWLDSIYKHCLCIWQNFSRYSSANNHLIGEAAGLFIASVVWSFGKESVKWQQKTFRILIEEMEKQNYKDGVNKEQAISYQQFVLDFFLLAGLLGKNNGIAFPPKYWDRLESMLVFVAAIMDKNGYVPNIGDADDGYVVKLCEHETFNSFQSLLATGAVLFHRGDFKRKAREFDEKTFWLLGKEVFEIFTNLESKDFKQVKSFDEGGYFILSNREDTTEEVKCIFDCGPVGYLSIAAHGHSDALSLVLHLGGKEFLIDPGTYAYHTQKEWRAYFRGTSAHNTLRIDREDQSVSGGNFMWLKKAHAQIIKWESTEDYAWAIGQHNGYQRLADPVTHQREIFFDKKKEIIRIVDLIKANGKHCIEQFFHFSRDCVIKQIKQGQWEISNKGKNIQLNIDKQLKSDLYYGSLSPTTGWQSKHFDGKEKTSTLINSCERSGNCEFVTNIFLMPRQLNKIEVPLVQSRFQSDQKVQQELVGEGLV